MMSQPLRSFPPEDLLEITLDLIGSYAHLQHLIDDLCAKRFLQYRLGDVAKYFQKASIERIRDSERPRLVFAIAAEADTDADLSDFQSTYSRVKTMRDLVAHAASVRRVAGGAYEIRVTPRVLQTGIPAKDDERFVTREELVEMRQACQWLGAQVLYVTSQFAGITMMVNGKEHKFARPPRLAKDWDGELLEWPGMY